MKIIVPCCGRSSRFPNLPPKWMLPSADGHPMIRSAVEGVACDFDDLIVTVLREHEQRFHVSDGLAAAFGRPITTCVLERQTKSQSETVAETIRALTLDEPFLVKDADGAFVLPAPYRSTNYVCVNSLNRCDLINPRNKSYVCVNESGRLTAILEKKVISDLFNVGGYFFLSAKEYLKYYEQLASDQFESSGEMYLSNVIASMIGDGIEFQTQMIDGYRDWGTLRDWRRGLLERKAYFISLDGFVFERGNRFFSPRFEDVKLNPNAVEAVKGLLDSGHQVTYLSIRPAVLADLTKRQLTEAGLPVGPIVFDCPVAKWTLVTAPHSTLPFRTSDALELSPGDVNVGESIRGDVVGDL